jgi:DNA modification methylase
MNRTLGCERSEVRSETFTAIRNDCVLEVATMPEKSIDFICTSIPFGNQYEYSPSFNDFGHCQDHETFFGQMDFLVPELLRVLQPGRVAAIHVKDRIRFGNVTGKGMPTVDRFSDKTADCFEKHGFEFMARITIDTDVVRENNQTYRLGWSENAKDSSKMGAGMPEYVLVFRRLPTDTSTAYADVQVTKLKSEYTRADWQIDAAGFWRSSGNRLPDPEIMLHMNMENIKRLWVEYSLAGGYNHKEHVELARALEAIGKLPASFMLFPPISRNKDVWTDIARMRTLNTEQSRRNQEKHVCPLQLDIIERLITRYTNPGDLVMDPFAGIGSVPYQAIKMRRRGFGVELNEEYWRCAVGYCEMAEAEMTAPTLFELRSWKDSQSRLRQHQKRQRKLLRETTQELNRMRTALAATVPLIEAWESADGEPADELLQQVKNALGWPAVR